MAQPRAAAESHGDPCLRRDIGHGEATVREARQRPLVARVGDRDARSWRRRGVSRAASRSRRSARRGGARQRRTSAPSAPRTLDRRPTGRRSARPTHPRSPRPVWAPHRPSACRPAGGSRAGEPLTRPSNSVGGRAMSSSALTAGSASVRRPCRALAHRGCGSAPSPSSRAATAHDRLPGRSA